MNKTSVFARRRVQHHAARRTSSMALTLLLLSVAATMPMIADAQLLRGRSAQLPSPPGRLGRIQGADSEHRHLTCNQTYCSGALRRRDPGRHLRSCSSPARQYRAHRRLFGAGVTVMRGDTSITGHYLGVPWHPSGRLYIISQPILLTVPPGHFLRFEAQSLGGQLSSAACTMAGQELRGCRSKARSHRQPCGAAASLLKRADEAIK